MRLLKDLGAHGKAEDRSDGVSRVGGEALLDFELGTGREARPTRWAGFLGWSGVGF